VALLQQEGLIKLTAYGGLEVIPQPHCAQMHVYRGFDLGNAEVGQVAEVLLTTSAQEVEVRPAVTFAGDEDHAVSAAVTPQQSLEPVMVSAFLDLSKRCCRIRQMQAFVALQSTASTP
jgi:hypothetical protein